MDAKKLYPALFKMTEKQGVLSGVLHEFDLVVATNKIVLAEVRFKYDPEHEGKVLSREGVNLVEEHGNYVKYRTVIPDKNTMQEYDGQISLKELTTACKNIIRVKKSDILHVLQIGTKYYNPEELIMLLNVFEIVEEAPSIYQLDSKQFTLFKSQNCTGLCFEMRIEGEDNEARKIFNISQALNYSKPITNNLKETFYE